MGLALSDVTPGPAERTLVIGTSRSGKSSLMDWQMRHIQETRPDCMTILVDSKPRFRAEQKTYLGGRMRKDASDLYESWSKGPVVPNSVVMDIHSDSPFRGMWKNPGEVVIMQSAESEDWIRMLRLIRAYVNSQIGGRERLVIVDEALDFYQRNSWGIDTKNDVFYRVARAGGERNIGIVMGAHRVAGIPPLILGMSNRIILFHLKTESDMAHLNKHAGITDPKSPIGDYVFRHWVTRPGGTVSPPVTGRMNYPQWYLNQLATT